MRRIISQILLIQDTEQPESEKPLTIEINQGLAYFVAPISIIKFYNKQAIFIIDSLIDAIIIIPIRIVFYFLLCLLRVKKRITRLQFKIDLVNFIIIWSIVLIISYSQYFELGLWYHTIRGQSQIKLYGIIQILDLLDRIACNQGDYIVKQLYWNRVNKTEAILNRYLIYSYIYIICHTCVIGLQMTVYNVIFSSNLNLLYLALFVLSLIKLKGSVFKKQDEKSVIQMSLDGGRELFQKMLYTILIISTNKFTPQDFYYKIAFYYMIEYIVDSFKNISIFHLNNIPLDLIDRYSQEVSNFSYSLALKRQLILENLSFIEQKDLSLILQQAPTPQMKILGKFQFTIFPLVVIVIKTITYFIRKNEMTTIQLLFFIIGSLAIIVTIKCMIIYIQKSSNLHRKLTEGMNRKKSQ
ncbi:hypothetical protein pb186bvf_008890 [Paramecium bursaria]